MRRLGFSLLCIYALLCSVSAAAPCTLQSDAKPLANTVVLIIRHAEKPEDGSGLTPAGEKRARAYPKYFNEYRLDGKPLTISHLFAAADSAGSMRPRLTVEPLSKSLHLKIDLRFTDKDPTAIAGDLMSHDYGRQILVSWRHGKIPALVKALGADPKVFVPEGKWPGDIYDRVIELHFDGQGKFDSGASRLVFEHLMPGDEK